MNYEQNFNEKSENLTRQKLLKLIEENFRGILNLPKLHYHEFVDAFFDEICKTLIQGEDVKISSFGSFLVKHKKERRGRNPKTKQEVIITARKVITFRASKQLISRISSLKKKRKIIYNID